MSPCFHSAFTDLSLSRPSTAPPASQCSPQPGCCAGLCGASLPAGEGRLWGGNAGCSQRVSALFGALFRAQLMLTHENRAAPTDFYIFIMKRCSCHHYQHQRLQSQHHQCEPHHPIANCLVWLSDTLTSPHVSWKLRSSGLQCDARCA